MTELLNPDICVIGAGPAGLEVSISAAGAGVPVVLVGKGPMGGRWCEGGLVATAWITAARCLRDTAQAGAFGVTADRAVDLGRLRDHALSLARASAPNVAKERLAGLGVRVVEGAACFKDGRTVMVNDAVEIKARRFVVATGSRPLLPSIPGLDSVPYLTDETVFDLAAAPAHLLVIGAGPAGLALAQAFRLLGSMVTVLDSAAPLAQEDPECAQIVLDQLERDGIAVRSPVTILRIEPTPAGIGVVLAGKGTIEGTHLLLAAGRTPDIEGLGLEAAGIACEPQGIRVDRSLRTTNRIVYAIGDVIGGASVEAARHHAGLVLRQALFRKSARLVPSRVARLTATEPELAHVGLTEAEAAGRTRGIRVLRWPYRENERTLVENRPIGHIKVVTDRGGRVLGATIVGTRAGDLVAPWSLAVGQGLDIASLSGISVPHPTFAEIGKCAAGTYFRLGLTRSWVRRIIDLVRRLG